MASIYSKAERYKDFLKWFFDKYQPRCCFCHQILTWATFFRRSLDEITKHHLNGDHYDDRIENKELSHRKCHLQFHRDWENAIQENKLFDVMKGINRNE